MYHNPVCDTAFLTVSPGHQSYGAAYPPPFWDDYRPKTLVLDHTESYDSSTKRVMHRANEEYQAAYRDWEARKDERKARRERYDTLVCGQTSSMRQLEAAAKIRKAFERCPRLRNLILSSCHSFITRKRRHDVLGIEVRVTEGMSVWPGLLVQVQRDLSRLSSLTLISTGIEGLAEGRRSVTLPNLKHFRINRLSDGQSSKEDLWNCALILRDAKSLETLSVALPKQDITDVVESIHSDCLRSCLLRFDRVSGSVLVDFLLRHAALLQRLGLSHGCATNGWSPVFRSVAGRLPALRRVQFETLRENALSIISPESAQEAGHFVVFGGSIPVLRLERRIPGGHFWGKSGRGIYIDGSEREQASARPLAGL